MTSLASQTTCFLKGAEYMAKFNLNSSVPYGPKWHRCEAMLVDGPWEKISEHNKGFVYESEGVLKKSPAA